MDQVTSDVFVLDVDMGTVYQGDNKDIVGIPQLRPIGANVIRFNGVDVSLGERPKCGVQSIMLPEDVLWSLRRGQNPYRFHCDGCQTCRPWKFA